MTDDLTSTQDPARKRDSELPITERPPARSDDTTRRSRPSPERARSDASDRGTR